MNDNRRAFLAAAGTAVALLGRQEVAANWGRPSALAEWSVGGVAAHLANQIHSTRAALESPSGDGPLVHVSDHYARAQWPKEDVHGEVNSSIRASADQIAADGPAELVRRTTAALGQVADLLEQTEPDQPIFIAWQGWSLPLWEFLITRMMEIAVHSDDLAASVGVDAPVLPAEVLEPVLTLLTDLAVKRHGQAAVLRALTRRERAPESITAF